MGEAQRGTQIVRCRPSAATFDIRNENGYRLRYMESCNSSKADLGQKPIAPNLFPGGRALSEQLVGGRGELVIEHKGREYRLRLTQSGKLILTA